MRSIGSAGMTERRRSAALRERVLFLASWLSAARR
jgi:hypothetical protein